MLKIDTNSYQSPFYPCELYMKRGEDVFIPQLWHMYIIIY